MRKSIYHLVFWVETGEVVYANTDQYKAQKACLLLVSKLPDLHFKMKHVDAKEISFSDRKDMRTAFNF